MTVLEKVKDIVFEKQIDLENDSIEKLLYLAYYIGREAATKEISDKFNAHLSAQSERAKNCRYHHMSESILQNGKCYIYSPDYRGEMTSLFGSDKTKF